MTVSRQEVERIARLAALEPDESEMEELLRDIDAIVEFVGRLRSIQNDDLPSFRVGPDRARLRADAHSPIPLQLPVNDLAPSFKDGFFLVPKMEGMGGE